MLIIDLPRAAAARRLSLTLRSRLATLVDTRGAKETKTFYGVALGDTRSWKPQETTVIN